MARRFHIAIGLLLFSFWSTALPVPTAAQPPAPSHSLDEILNLALTRHPSVAGAEGLVDQSRGRRIEAGAYPNPTITGQSGGGIVRDPSTGTELNEYLFSLSQPLEWFGKRAARQRAAEAGLIGAAAGLEETRLNLTAEVKIAFYDLLLAQRATELAKQNLAIVQEVARMVKARVQSGEGAQFEFIKAEVELMKADQELTRAQNAIRIKRVRVDTLTAGALGPVFTIHGDFASFDEGARLEIGALTRTALDRHPTIRRLAKLVERAGFAVTRERQSRIPDVTVYGGVAREVGREAYIGGLSVPTPIWYQRQGEIAAALGAKRREEADLLRARYELVRAINEHFQDAKTAVELIELFEKGLLKQAQEALRVAQFSFRQGVSSLLEVLDAQRVYRQTQLEYALARFDLSAARAKLERAVGGPLEAGSTGE
jgi:cobalt-zinc-cadmium efflux system outer membrane protein